MSRFLVTGVTGQIGSYLAELAIGDGHEVLGVPGIDGAPMPRGVALAPGSLDDPDRLLAESAPLDAVVHLASRSSVATSWKEPVATFDSNARLAVALVFAASKYPGLRFVHASSAEIFGNAPYAVQDERTPIAPVSPYAVAKAAAHFAVRVAREGLGVPAHNLVFYLGESPRRAEQFVFRKITRGVAAIVQGRAKVLELGTMSVVRDFCHARDLARALLLAATRLPPDDYVCASGEGHTIFDVAALACKMAGVDPNVIRSDPSLVRAHDVQSLVGDSTRIRGHGWRAEVGFEALVREVLEHDLALAQKATP